eukprot:m.1005329 g.1005329  ORF g.1005329 m.1005329 type:complete len:70 (-) comp24049_c0_seq1:125-334(-)
MLPTTWSKKLLDGIATWMNPTLNGFPGKEAQMLTEDSGSLHHVDAYRTSIDHCQCLKIPLPESHHMHPT